MVRAGQHQKMIAVDPIGDVMISIGGKARFVNYPLDAETLDDLAQVAYEGGFRGSFKGWDRIEPDDQEAWRDAVRNVFARLMGEPTKG